MNNNNLIIVALVAIIIVLSGIVVWMTVLITSTNDTNESSNVTLNDSENSTNVTKTTTDPSSKSKSSDSNIKSESIKENYLAGDGSHYREVEYKDGNFRQYDSNGKLICSSYESNQAQLKRDAGDSWPGD